MRQNILHVEPRLRPRRIIIRRPLEPLDVQHGADQALELRTWAERVEKTPQPRIGGNLCVCDEGEFRT